MNSEFTTCRVCGNQVDYLKNLMGNRIVVPIPLYHCPKCDTHFTYPKEFMEQRQFDNFDMDWYLARKPKAQHKITRVLETMARKGVKHHGKFLDIGCGMGYSMEVAKQFGYDAMGVEPLVQAAELALKDGLQVKKGFYDKNDYGPNSIDFIWLDQVLEHVYEPRVLFADIVHVMKPGGFFFVGLPVVNWLWLLLTDWKITSKINVYNDPEEHINYYGRKGIENLCRQNGVQIHSIYYPKAIIEIPFKILGLTTGYYLIQKPIK